MLRFLPFVGLLLAACGASNEPAPGPTPGPADASSSPDGAATQDAGTHDAACDWGYSCNGSKCICTGGKLDNKACADAPTCQKTCGTGC